LYHDEIHVIIVQLCGFAIPHNGSVLFLIKKKKSEKLWTKVFVLFFDKSVMRNQNAVNKSFCFALDKSNAVLLELALIFV